MVNRDILTIAGWAVPQSKLGKTLQIHMISFVFILKIENFTVISQTTHISLDWKGDFSATEYAPTMDFLTRYD